MTVIGTNSTISLSHASEDKEDFVRHLAKNLSNAGCRVWYDEFELKLGDSLRKKSTTDWRIREMALWLYLEIL